MKYLLIGLGAFALIGVMALLTAWPVELLWNSTISGIFRIREITFWEAFRIRFFVRVIVQRKFQ